MSIPWNFIPCVSTSNAIDSYRILGKPIKVSGNESESQYFFVYADNFLLGSCWGILSGYTGDAFFKPVMKPLRSMLKSNILLSIILANRVIRRMTLSGLLFHAVERKAAENLGMGMQSSTTSSVAGLTALATVFRVSRSVRESVFISTFILGGYVIGTKIAHFFGSHKTKREGPGSD